LGLTLVAILTAALLLPGIVAARFFFRAADTAEIATLVQSFVILRNALVRMIDDGTVPSQADLEKRLFCSEGQ
jgi:hypothetical protein